MNDPGAGQPSRNRTLSGPFIIADLMAWVERENELAWEPFLKGVDRHWIYGEGEVGPAVALLRFAPGGPVPWHVHQGYEHIFILRGAQTDQNGTLSAGGLMIHPPGTQHSVSSADGCLALAIYERRVKFLTPLEGSKC